MPTVTYANTKPYASNRPIADVVLVGPTGKRAFGCLVDTGADFLQLPAAAAGLVGIALASGVPHPILTAGGGRLVLTRVPNIRVEIEGRPVVVDVLFGPTASPAPLGRQALLAAFEVGFDATAWHRL